MNRRSTGQSTGMPLGFTLMELLVVISIICLLMSITLPSLTRAREQGKRVVCLSNMRSLTQCWLMYALENDDRLCSADTGWDVPPDWVKIELQQKWERLSERLRLPMVRRWVNEYPTVVFSVAAASIMLLLAIVTWLLIPDKPLPIVTIEKEWYYDLNTGKLFTAEKGLEPPIEAPSGPLSDGTPAGVRAYVLSYVYEPNESERFIGFLETTTSPEILAKLPARRDRVNAARKWGKGRMIRKVDDKLWIPADSKLGQQILEEAFAPNKNGERPTYCRPQ